MAGASDEKDFFVSYTRADKDWAEWIAWTLEEAGYSTVIQAWDFRPGSNFVLEMQQSSATAKRLIAVLSEDYLRSAFAAPEWAAAFAGDPEGAARKLVPVMVRRCDPGGLLAQVVQIRLSGLDVADAKRELLAGVEVSRSKPVTPPAFPGAADSSSDSRAVLLTGSLPWQPLQGPVELRWRSALRRYRSYGAASAGLELHVVSIDARIEARVLADAQIRLIDLGRRQGLFKMEARVDVFEEDGAIILEANQDERGWDTAGMVVTRAGQVGCWYTLPHDSLGAVLDEADARTRIHMLLEIIKSTGLVAGESVAIGIGIAPVGMLQMGNVSDVGKRSSATMSLMGNDEVRLDPDDSLPIAALDRVNDVADELVARLVAAVRLKG